MSTGLLFVNQFNVTGFVLFGLDWQASHLCNIGHLVFKGCIIARKFPPVLSQEDFLKWKHYYCIMSLMLRQLHSSYKNTESSPLETVVG